MNLLLTGPPGCGKTTVVRRVIERLGDLKLAGFYSQEIRQHGQRVGFEAVGLTSTSAILAHADFQSRHRVGKYGVDLVGFEALIQTEISLPPDEVDLFVIDEIGRMECLSPSFIAATRRVLDATTPVLATIAAKGGGFIGEVKTRPDVELIVVSPDNRDGLPEQLATRLGQE